MSAFFIWKERKRMMFPKGEHVRLKGKKIEDLNNEIFERDNYCCIVCKAEGKKVYVSPLEKFHHEPCGASKSDEINKGVVLCFKHHQERHFGKEMLKVKNIIMNYLKKMYD